MRTIRAVFILLSVKLCFVLATDDSVKTVISRRRLSPVVPTSSDTRPTVPPDTSTCFHQPSCPPVQNHRFVTVDGTCNNRIDKNRGRAQRSHKRLLPAKYANKIGLPRGFGGDLPSPRVISTTMTSSVTQQSPSLSHLVPWWGQYIVHDISRTPNTEKNYDGTPVQCSCNNPSQECMNIPIPVDDVQRQTENKTCFSFKRSQPVPDTAGSNCDTEVRQQMNAISGFIDLSTIYGNTQEHLDALLDPESNIGELKVQRMNYHGTEKTLPLQSEVDSMVSSGMSCPRNLHKPTNIPCFVAGDKRVNENTGLASVHTIILRKHNQIANQLHTINPAWNGKKLFDTTRAILTATEQFVTYKYFLPVIIGEEHISWSGNQGARFRLKDSYFNSEPILDESSGGVNSIMRGLAKDAAMAVDPTFTEDLRNFLFAEQGKFGFDLMARNIQRGRDHGLPGYNEWREFCGLTRVTDFTQLTEIPRTARKKLKELYSNVDDIDLYIGGVSETPVRGGAVGPTFACLIGYQFRDIRRGDRFWFENGGVFQYFTPDQLAAIREYSFPRLLCDTASDTRTVQQNPMKVEGRGNRRLQCSEFPALNLEPWRVGAPAQTQDTPQDTEADSYDSEWTVWFPTYTRGGMELTVAETFNHLLRHRIDEVCREVLETETKVVNGRTQVRFQCPPGTTRYSDYPQVETEQLYWTDWVDNSTPDRRVKDDDESRVPDQVGCFKPLAIQAQTTAGIPASETGEPLIEYSPILGLVCKGIDQRNRRCSDYRVRYLCRRGDEFSLRNPEENSQWTEWINRDNPAGTVGDTEYLYRARGTPGLCRIPIAMEARTVDDKTPASDTNDVTHMSLRRGFVCLHKDQPSGRKCRDYEVRYKCPVVNSASTPRPGVTTASTRISRRVTRQARFMCYTYGLCCA
ncbi:LOW QUALITY PROTEIN: salivary peroxidase/catechol oxidase-like [Ciona intestinalis]